MKLEGVEKLDSLTRKYTGFSSFEQMICDPMSNAHRPTLACNNSAHPEEERADLLYLSDWYDRVQELRGDSRRVYRTGDLGTSS